MMVPGCVFNDERIVLSVEGGSKDSVSRPGSKCVFRSCHKSHFQVYCWAAITIWVTISLTAC